MKPAFAVLQQHYPKSETRAELYADIGWSDVLDHAAFKNTCAIRMSVGLLRAHVPLAGANMKAKARPLKDQRIETGQGRLSNILKRRWGPPEVYKGENAARDGIKQRTGLCRSSGFAHSVFRPTVGTSIWYSRRGTDFNSARGAATLTRLRSGSGR